jgi:hypothetical protein
MGVSFEATFEIGERLQAGPVELADPPLSDVVDRDRV